MNLAKEDGGEVPMANFTTAFTARRSVPLLALVLILATLAVYYPVHRYPFISLNDGEYVTQNSHIEQLNWETVKWSFTAFYAANWHPLTWLSHALDRQVFSLNPGWHHVSNLLLHLLNTLVLFWVLWRATSRVGCSFMVAALFALHPVNVESVAWIAERKNVLSMLFFLLALGAYRWYAVMPGIGRYLAVAGLFVLGLMSKPQVITLPFVLLLWDYWPLQRMFAPQAPSSTGVAKPQIPARSFSWLILEKLLLMPLCAASALITMKSQLAGGAMGGVMRAYPLHIRVENAIICYVRYLINAVWPTRLAFFYPHAKSFHSVVPECLLLLMITALVFLHCSHRYLVVGWLWFLGTLVPMIGVIQVGGQAMADRYAYLSFIGLFIAVCWGVADWAHSRRIPDPLLTGASVAALALLAFTAHRQLSYWSSDLALWAHTVQVTTNNSGAENMLAETLKRGGHNGEAMAHFRAAEAMDPLLPFPHYHLGIYEQEQGDVRAALDEYKRVIALTRNDPGVLADLRADTLVRMYYAYDAIGDSENAKKSLSLAMKEQHKQQKFENTDE